MYNGKFAEAPVKKRWHGSKRTGTVMLSLLLLLVFSISSTLAYLVTHTEQINNIFTPGKVTCDVTDEVTNNYKTNIQVTNTGNVDAYLRVRMVSYRVNDRNEIIGGTATVEYEPPEGSLWIHYGDHYYYTLPVEPGAKPSENLVQVAEEEDPAGKGILLVSYVQQFVNGEKTNPVGDVAGGKQVIAVVAEAIQADGVDKDGNHPVTLAWGMVVNTDGILSAPTTTN